MISATRRFFRRHRTSLTVGAGIAGLGFLLTKYVRGKIADAREQYSSDRIARENLARRFNQNQEDCTFTVLALLPTATDNVLAELETERITYELNQQKASNRNKHEELQISDMASGPPTVTEDDGRSTASVQSESGVHASQISMPGQPSPQARKTKAQLWYDLKISSITRAFTLLYTLALLTLMTRIQLNLLGRRSYLSSVVSLATGPTNDAVINLENHDDDNPDHAYGNDFETNRRYLTFSWWLLHRGWREIMRQVDAAVRDVFGPLSPRDEISLERFSLLTLDVRRKVEGPTERDRTSRKWLPYLLPARDDEAFVLTESGMASEPATSQSPLRRLLDETADLVDSPPFAHVLTLLLDAGFSTLVDDALAAQAFGRSPPPAARDTNPLSVYNDPSAPPLADGPHTTTPVKLPIVLAVLTKQAHAIGNGVPNEYLAAMEKVKELEAFAAVVYSSNWQAEIGADEGVERSRTAALPAREASLVDLGRAGREGAEDTAEEEDPSGMEKAWDQAVRPSP